ncbi:MAG: ATP-binding protein [Candidatus Zixiibacteriota bacterium]
MSSYEFIYPSVLESEGKMLKDMLQILKKHGVDGLSRHSMLVVISEAFSNALVHGNRLDPSKQIKIAVDINKNEMTADIIDEGQGGLEKISRRKPSETWAENGRGIGIMGHYAASVEFFEMTDGGLRVSIRFKREHTNVVNSR